MCCAECGEHSRGLECGEYRFVRCSSCGLLYQYPQPVFEDLKSRYDGEYFVYERENEEQFFRLMMLGLEDIGFQCLEKRLDVHRFLDIGCATGMLLEHMVRRGWKGDGVELCRASAEFGNTVRGVPVFPGTLEEAAFADGTFSFIHFSHLIEHLNNPSAFLAEVSRVLMPGGYAVAVTPNADGFQAKLLQGRWRSAIADHLYLFTPGTLNRTFEKNGFKIRSVKTWGGIAQGLVPRFIKHPIDFLAKRFGFGDVMIVLAEKL